MEIIVSGVGIVSGIGFGTAETLQAIAGKKSGLGTLTLFDSVYKDTVPVAEVKAANSELKQRLGLPERKTFSRTALLGLLAATQAAADAQLPLRKGLRTGFVSGTTVGGMDRSEIFYRSFFAHPDKGRLRDVAVHDCADSTEQIAARIGATDYITTVSTACSSGANAIILGARLIKHGIVDCVVAGGVDALCKFTLNGFASLKILDNAPCRPLDESRAGLNLGEGAGYVVLERKSDAAPPPYCRLAGYANVCEAFHQTASSPEGNGPFEAMRQALDVAGMPAEAVDYINFHGTGTPNNDLAEGNAVKRLFAKKTPFLSSTKAFTGHTLGAAGGIEAVLSALAIKHGLLYPNLNYAHPIPEHGLTPVTGFRQGVEINVALSNSFGFGGNDSSLLFSKA
ncbi:MAG: beta-ketoacyl-[acyl-carrier-protein] synthase family protein [Prevotellaceae bacterium]|jgi:3-oxoacyl-[acyl-carrier-protein] synthase-1|nr:beta-ketoacyl-[acyl-carrier-protein] synthase family protein [Prevotellaceae bacterium]